MDKKKGQILFFLIYVDIFMLSVRCPVLHMIIKNLMKVEDSV